MRDRLALEEAREIDTVIFDKTGTLTEGEFGVVGMAVAAGWDEDAGPGAGRRRRGRLGAHHRPRHPPGSARSAGLALPAVTDFEALKGRGVRAPLATARTVYVGGPRLLEMLDLALPETLAGFAAAGRRQGPDAWSTWCEDGQVAAAFALADVIRPESRAGRAAAARDGRRRWPC